MKSFSYSCRDKNGGLKRGTIQANDRADVIRQLKTQGCVPISISEGAAGLPSGAKLRLQPRVLALAGVALAVIAGLLILRTTPKATTDSDKTATAAKNHKAVKPASKAAPALAKKTTASTNKIPEVSAQTAPADIPTKTRGQETKVAAAVAPEQQAEEKPPEIRPELAFKTPTEQLIGMLGRPGEDRPPLPISPDEDLEDDFSKAITNVIVIGAADDENTAAHKENVAWIKQYIKDAKAMGWSPGEYIRELELKRMEEASERSAAQKLMDEIEETSPQDAQAVREALNKELEKKGILPLDAPEPE